MNSLRLIVYLFQLYSFINLILILDIDLIEKSIVLVTLAVILFISMSCSGVLENHFVLNK